MKVGFVGLGDMGSPMAQMIMKQLPLTVYARREEALEPFRDGASIAASLKEIAESTDVVCVCVVDDTQVEEVVASENGLISGARDGSVILVHSTVHPDTCRRLADVAARKNVTLMDAPVSGGRPVALAGKLAVMAGGDDETFARCRPIFECYGERILLMGPVGSGLIAKLINNALLGANLVLAQDAIRTGGALHVRTEELTDLLSAGSAQSWALDWHTKFSRENPESLRHGLTLLKKDVRLATEVARTAGLDVPLFLQIAARAVEEQPS